MRGSVSKLLITSLLLWLLIYSIDLDAQCAMCKATTESAHRETGETGNGINKGILYIMFIPYALIATLLAVFFKNKWLPLLQSLGLFR